MFSVLLPVAFAPLCGSFWTSSHEVTSPVTRMPEAASIRRRNSLRFRLNFGHLSMARDLGTARLRWYVAFATMRIRVVPKMISARRSGMFTLAVAA